MARIGYIFPQYGNFDYTERAIKSFFQHTPDGYCILVDDCSPYWDGVKTQDRFAQLLSLFPSWPTKVSGSRGMFIHRHSRNLGLTACWNYGLEVARDQGLDYCVCGNNDLLFSPDWYKPLLGVLWNYQLVGPVSNAPGVSAKGLQDVVKYMPEYQLSDDSQEIAHVADVLRSTYTQAGAYETVESPVNGFCLLAKTETWWEGKFDDDHVFCPRNDFYSKGDLAGKPNPTPLMTLNEDELQIRWRAKGWHSAIVPSSFVFHYRAVTRGMRHVHGQWMRFGAKP
jgi:glycosyltransferase involved in cell wall biosynthesis